MPWQRHRILAVRRQERSICSLPCSARRTVLETRLLYTMGVNIQKLYAAVLGAMGYDNEAIQEEFQAAKAMQNLGGSPTPALDQYSRDLTQMAAEGKLGPLLWGREKGKSAG